MRDHDVLRALNCRPVAYYPVYRFITGSTTGGILLSQLMYWFSKKDKIYKTDSEIIEETGLSKNELRSAKAIIKKLDFIKVSLEGIPAKTFYEISWGGYEASLVEFTKLDSWNSLNCDGEIHETITENTTKIKTADVYLEIPDSNHIQDLSLSRTPQVPPPPPSGQDAPSHNTEAQEGPVDRLERLWDYLAGKYSLAMPTKPLTATRRHMLAVRAKQGMAEKCRDICKAFSESPLLQGNVVRKDTQHERPWKPDFEWLFKNDTNWVRVIEGKYADRVQQEQAPNNEAW